VSLFWLIAVFTPLSYLLPPPSPRDTFNPNVDVSVLGGLASGYWSNKSKDNAVMLTGGWRNESGWQIE
jgi:hypothetical protein